MVESFYKLKVISKKEIHFFQEVACMSIQRKGTILVTTLKSDLNVLNNNKKSYRISVAIQYVDSC